MKAEKHLELIEKGYRIIPVMPRGKNPFLKNWQEMASDSREQVEEWARTYPDCNWGIVCSNVIVFDLDRKKKDADGNEYFLTDEEMFKHWHYFQETYHLPPAPEVVTGSGGRHYYYKKPAGDFIAAPGFKYVRDGKTVESNIDIRVGNSQVVAPGSVNADGNEYQCPHLWAVNELNELPADFVAILPKKNLTAAPPLVSDRPAEYRRGADVVERCRRYVEQMNPAVQGQGGHGQLLNAAIVIFWNFGLEREEGWPIFMDYCTRCLPPYTDEREIEHKYQEAFKKGPDSGPRGWMANWKPDNGYDSEKIDRMLNILTVNGKRPQSAPTASDGQPAQDAGESVRKPKFRIQPDADFAADIFASFGKSEKVIKTGFAEVDDFLDGGLSGLTILGGIPAVGKSSFALQIADHNAAQGLRVLIVSLEMSRKQLVAKTVSRLTGGLVYGHDDGALMGYLNAAEVARCPKQDCLTVRQIMRTKANEWEDGELALYQHAKSLYEDYIQIPRYILQREKGELRRVASFDIIEALEWYKQTGGFMPDLIVTDYLQLFDEVSDAGRDLTDKQQADQAVGNLKLISEDVPVIAVASFNRASYYQEASRESFKESGGLEYTAETLLALQPSILWGDTADDNKGQIEDWKGQDPRPIDLVILKDRYGEDGKTFNFGMLPKCGGFYYAGSYKVKKQQKQSYRSNSPLMADVIAAVSSVLRVQSGFEMQLGDMFETMAMEYGFTEQDVRRAINQPKSCLKRYNDADGIEQVRLITEKKKAADVSTDEPRELDEQDALESID